MSTTHNVDLGLLNSTMTITAFALKAIFTLFVGYIFSALSFGNANLTIGALCFVANSVVAISGSYCLTEYRAVARPAKRAVSCGGEITEQYTKFRASSILKILLAEVISNIKISGAYVGLIFLRCGLSELGYSYITAACYGMVLLGCVANIFKKKLRFNGHYIPVFIVFKAVQFFFAVYLITAYITVIFLPWFRGTFSLSFPFFNEIFSRPKL